MRDIRPQRKKRSVVLPDDSELKPLDGERELYEVTRSSKEAAARQAAARRAAGAGVTAHPDSHRTARPGGRRGQRLPAISRQSPRLHGSTVPVTPVLLTGAEAVHSDSDHSSDKPRRRSGAQAARVLPSALERQRSQTVRTPRLGGRERVMLVAFVGLTLVVGLIGAIIFLPTAAITLTLRTAPLLVDERLTITAADAGEKTVPGTAFFRELGIEDSVPVESTEKVGTKAGGVVVIVNATSQEQPIKDRSRLTASDGQLFYMQKHAIVPPGGRMTVPVEAAAAGDEYNLTDSTRLNFAALDASSQRVVYAEVGAGGLTGGSGETISVIKEVDVERARTHAAEQAREQAAREVEGDLEEGWSILPESWTTEFAEFTPQQAVGDRSPTLPYRARVTVRVLGYEKRALEETLRTAVEQQLADDFMLFPGPISYEASVHEVNWDETRTTLAVRVTHSTIPALSLQTLREKLAGRSVEQAQQYLEGLPGVERATMETWPFWVRSIPRIEKRISLNYESNRQP